MRKEDFLSHYYAVFGPNGKVFPCGREACVDLIKACNEFSNPRINYGNVETGQMNIDAIKHLVLECEPRLIFQELYLQALGGDHLAIDSIDEKHLAVLAAACDLTDKNFGTKICPKVEPEILKEIDTLYQETFLV